MNPAIIARMRGFVEQDGAAIRDYALRLSGNNADAEDLTQESFRKVLSRWPHHVWPLKPWCMTLVRHLHFDAQRRTERKRTVSLDMPMSGNGPSFQSAIPDSGQTPEQIVERQEVIASVRQTLRGMKSIHREVLKLCLMQGMSYRDAAKALSIPLGTMRSRLHRARLAFQLMHRGPRFV